MTPHRVVARADDRCGRLARPPGVPAQQLAPGVSAVLDLQRAAGNGATAGLLVPVQRQKKKAAGVAKYGTTRLTDRLNDMMQRGVLGVAGAPATLDRDQLFVLQGVANVETGGKDNAVYTRDNMYVSLGFKQVTLSWGSLYEIIEAAPGAFAKHGIVLGGGTYTLKAGVKPAIEGAPDPVMLKTPPWTDRFFAAGGEDEVVSAMVAYTLKEQGRMERRFAKDSPGKSNPWMRDPTARAWLLEAMNNRPVFAYAAAKRTLRPDQRAGDGARGVPRRARVRDPPCLRGARRGQEGSQHHQQDPPHGAAGRGHLHARGSGHRLRPPSRPQGRPGRARRAPSWWTRPRPSCHPRRLRGAGRALWQRSAPPVSSSPRCGCWSPPGTATPTH